MRYWRCQVLCLLLPPPILWGSNFVVGRALHGDVDPFTLNYWRWVVALLVLTPCCWRMLIEAWPLLRARWRWVVTLGALSVVSFNTLVYAALDTLPAGEGALIHAATPFVAMIISAWVLGERFRLWQISSACLSFLGAVLVIGASAMAWSSVVGDGLMLLSVMVWALYSVMLKFRPPALRPQALLLAVILVGVLIQTPFYVALGDPVMLLDQSSTKALVGIIYLGVVASVLAYWLWDKGIAAVGPAAATQFFHIVPVSAAVLGWAYLGEALSKLQVAGVCLVMLGIACTIGQARIRPAASAI